MNSPLARWLDAWQELVGTLARNPIRTGLTAAGVAWGMFLLVMLSGFGAGLEAGVQSSLGRRATNAIWFWSRTTSLPYKGGRAGRPVHFTNADMEAIVQQVDGIEFIVPQNQLGGWRGQSLITLGTESTTGAVTGHVETYRHIQPMRLDEGRYLNHRDEDGRRRVAVVGRQIAEDLSPEGGSVLGERVAVDGSWFTVIGVFSSRLSSEDADRVESSVHIPLSTFQQAFRQGDRVRWFGMTGAPDASAERIEAEARAVLAARHRVHPEDKPAIGSRNAGANYRRLQATFAGIRAFVLLVGTMTLLAGAFGVTNVMLVSVGERTPELGLRRALGATRGQIRQMILRESLLLTLVAGQTGLLAGVAVIELARRMPNDSPLGAPHIDATLVGVAAILMVLAGVVAGALPAARAAAITPIQALRGQ